MLTITTSVFCCCKEANAYKSLVHNNTHHSIKHLYHNNVTKKQYFKNLLVIAANEGNANVVQQYLSQGADPNKQDRFGSTALMRAAIKGNGEIIEKLLSFGANANMQDQGGATALMMAIRNGNTEITELLIPHSDISIKDKLGFNAQQRALAHPKVLMLFEKYSGKTLPWLTDDENIIRHNTSFAYRKRKVFRKVEHATALQQAEIPKTIHLNNSEAIAQEETVNLLTTKNHETINTNAQDNSVIFEQQSKQQGLQFADAIPIHLDEIE